VSFRFNPCTSRVDILSAILIFYHFVLNPYRLFSWRVKAGCARNSACRAAPAGQIAWTIHPGGMLPDRQAVEFFTILVLRRKPGPRTSTLTKVFFASFPSENTPSRGNRIAISDPSKGPGLRRDEREISFGNGVDTAET
jgi:hypothetical protein